VSTNCQKKSSCRGNARSRSMASLVCAQPAFNSIAGLVVRESVSGSLNPPADSGLLRSDTASAVFSYHPLLGEAPGRLQTSGRLYL
jgi:hypothetical protein